MVGILDNLGDNFTALKPSYGGVTTKTGRIKFGVDFELLRVTN